MLKPIRYSGTNGALYIGGRKYKLAIFTRQGCARLHLLAFGEGMAFMVEQKKESKQDGQCA